MARHRPDSRTGFVIVVNDDLVQLRVLSGLLEQEENRVLSCGSAEEALEKMNPEQPPDLIVTDLHMPGIDGWRFCQLLRSPEYKPFNRIPILVISATFSCENPRRISADVGANAFLPAPIDGTRFLEQVQTLLAGETPQVTTSVLIVEDNRTLLDALQQAFDANGYRTMTATTGAEGMALFRRERPEIVVLDYHLPDMLGDAMLSEIRLLSPRSVTVMTTTDPNPELAVEWLRKGASTYVRKPFEPEYLITLCRRAQRERALLDVEDVLEERTRELRVSEERYASLFNTILDGIVIATVDGHIVDANPSFQKMVGYSLDELAGMTYRQITPKARHQKETEAIEAVLAAGSGGRFEKELIRQDGTVFPVAIMGWVIRDMRGKAVGLGALIRDLTKQKRAEQQIRESEERFRVVVEDLPVLLCRSLPGGIITFVNKAYCDYFGKTRAELIGRSFLELVPAEDRDVVMQHFSSLTPENPVVTYEHRVQGRDEAIRWQRWTDRAIFDEDGAVAAYQSIGQDITEERRLEAQLRQAQKMESIGRIAGGVAHDFNNLLQGILGRCEMAMLKLSPGQPGYSEFAEINAIGSRATAFVRQLLAFSRKQVLELKTISLVQVVTDLQKMLRRTIRENIELKISLPPSLGNIRADVSQVEQVLVNLAVNAQDAMPHGGTLTIEAADVVLDETFVKAHPGSRTGPHVAVTVRDTGRGMDRQTLKQVFEPFFTTKEQGTGLGLSTVYGIVKQHNGSVWAYSERGKGATFKIYFPRVNEPVDESAAPPPAAPERADRGSEKVVVVEDNEMVRKLVYRMLKEYGYDLVCAENAEECLRLLKEHRGAVDLLLTDVVMPGMNGRELYEQLKSFMPDLKVIYMSGYSNEVIAPDGVLDEGVDFIQKPVTVRTLTTKVREVLDR